MVINTNQKTQVKMLEERKSGCRAKAALGEFMVAY